MTFFREQADAPLMGRDSDALLALNTCVGVDEGQ
jgi:hypothetical protein